MSDLARGPAGAPSQRPGDSASAFFDVDETLVTINTMASFLRYYLIETSAPARSFERAMSFLEAATKAGRAPANRAYYRLFAGAEAQRVVDIGRRWFAGQDDQALFNQVVLAAAERHVRDGVRVVLVSGAFDAIIEPIARFIGASTTACSVPQRWSGRHTGGSQRTMIGDEKGVAVRELARAAGHNLADCWAYGGEFTDLPMLTAVGHPVAVGSDARLAAEARRRGWQVLDMPTPDAATTSQP